MISNFISRTAKSFALKQNERIAIERLIKKVKMALSLDKPFFKQHPVVVEPFGSFVNGAWPSGS